MTKEKVLGILPARLGSTRMKRKMLAQINGKPLIYYTWKQAKRAKTLDAVVIATDSEEIRQVAEAFGAEVIMTPESIKSGSDRVAYASRLFKKFKPTIVVNIQGDEPLIPPKAIDDPVRLLMQDKKAVVSTPATPFISEKDIQSPAFVKVVTDLDNNALYFSRSVLPFPRTPYKGYLKHMGLYVFRYNFLQRFTLLPQSKLELAESLEQLRILENGFRIKVAVGNYPNLEVNTPSEFRRVKKLIEQK